jgi:DNA-directed RNA polymerase alpha subunit
MTDYSNNSPQNQSDLPKLASPARRALAEAGITSLAQLAGMSKADLLRLHGIGPNAIQALRQALQEKGLSFLPDRALAGNE